jgi:hypothetical protein
VNLNRIYKYVLSVAAATIALASMPSQATIISATSNNPYSFNWSFGSAAGQLTGTGSLTLSGFNSLLLTVNVTLNNTSALSTNRLTSFGFGINPNAWLVGFSDNNDGGLVNASLASIPSLTSIEVCAFSGPNCSGGGNGGIAGGASDTFTMLLGGLWGSSVDIDPIGFKYQTAVTSYEFTTKPVPEPGSIALLAIGLLGLSAGMRKRVG